MYSYHPQYVDAIAHRMRADDSHIYLQDANYNVTSLLSSTGTVVERYSYTPYGEVTVLEDTYAADSDNKSDVDNEILYTGRERDVETGLQLNRNRWYHQQLGRWMSRDPIGYGGGTSNLYEYTSTDPLNYTDPLGLRIVRKIFPISKFPTWGRFAHVEVIYDVQDCSVALLGCRLRGWTFWGVGTYEVECDATAFQKPCSDIPCDCTMVKNAIFVEIQVVKTLGYRGVGYVMAPERLKKYDIQYADKCCCE
jgi:RHS repeat-associated protein